MTRREYEAIAYIFATLRRENAPVDWVTVGTIEEKLANMFAASSSSFDHIERGKFYLACRGLRVAVFVEAIIKETP